MNKWINFLKHYSSLPDDQTELTESNSNEDLYEYGAGDPDFDDDLDEQGDLEIEINSGDESHDDENEENVDDDEDVDDEENLKYLVKQLAVEASLSSINLNGKIILNNNTNVNKKDSINPNENQQQKSAFSRNKVIYANTNSTTSNYFNASRLNLNPMDVEDLVDNLNKNFDKYHHHHHHQQSEQIKAIKYDPDESILIDQPDENLDSNSLKLPDENSANMTDTEIQSILRSSDVSTDSFVDEVDISLKNINNNLQSIYKQHNQYADSYSSLVNQNAPTMYSSLKKPQPQVKHVSSTIVRPVKQYHQQNHQTLENNSNNGLKKSFNSTILVQKPLIISPIEAITHSLGRGGITGAGGARGSIASDQHQDESNSRHTVFNKIQPLADINFNNIKIEKKIRLNYRRPPQHFANTNNTNSNNYLNFGTLC